jgi:hypothetical protein
VIGSSNVSREYRGENHETREAGATIDSGYGTKSASARSSESAGGYA